MRSSGWDQGRLCNDSLGLGLRLGSDAGIANPGLRSSEARGTTNDRHWCWHDKTRLALCAEQVRGSASETGGSQFVTPGDEAYRRCLVLRDF